MAIHYIVDNFEKDNGLVLYFPLKSSSMNKLFVEKTKTYEYFEKLGMDDYYYPNDSGLPIAEVDSLVELFEFYNNRALQLSEGSTREDNALNPVKHGDLILVKNKTKKTKNIYFLVSRDKIINLTLTIAPMFISFKDFYILWATDRISKEFIRSFSSF